MAEELIRWMVQIALPVLAGFAGAFLGAWLTRVNDQRKQRLNFAEQQLREFYSPLLGIRTHIHTLAELRVRVEDVADSVWGTLVTEAQSTGGAQAVSALRKEKWEGFEKIITADNERFRQTLMPLYIQMLTTFREKYWLADKSTRAHFGALLEFVELWQRWLNREIPPDVITKLDVREGKLDILYQDLDSRFEGLQKALKTARPERV